MAFVNDTGMVAAVFSVSVAANVTDAEVVEMFNALVAAAEANTLVAGTTVIASTVSFGESKKTHFSLLPKKYIHVIFTLLHAQQACLNQS